MSKATNFNFHNLFPENSATGYQCGPCGMKNITISFRNYLRASPGVITTYTNVTSYKRAVTKYLVE